MKASGQNLPHFTDVQLEFSAHIRNPELHPRPVDVEQRRMDIYVGLFYRNIESFLVSAFPVLKSCLDTQTWDNLVREFVHLHASESPYFLEISQEFLSFLDQRGLDGLPAYALELAHYEWVELALDVATAEVENNTITQDDPLPEYLGLSELAQPLAYQFDVHTIGPEHQPEQPNPRGCFLIACRDPNDLVRFIESNPITHRLIDLLATESVSSVYESLHSELSEAGSDVERAAFDTQLSSILHRLLEQYVLIPVTRDP